MPKLIYDSCFKMVLYYYDGNSRTRYSWDWNDKHSKMIKPQTGLNQLERHIRANLSKIRTALIYDIRLVPDTLIRQWNDGRLVLEKEVDFTIRKVYLPQNTQALKR